MSVSETLREAWTHRRAWWFTATSRTRARFARTALGSFWLGISNLLSISVLGYVYGNVFRVPDFTAYFVYLGIGLTAWGMISGSISSAPQLFDVNSRNLLNTNINPIFYTLEEWAFQVQTFFQSLLVVAIALSFFQPFIFPHLLTVGIAPLVNLLILCYWLPLLVCLLGAKFHDIYQLVPILLQLVFLLSPILFKREALGSVQWVSSLNPLYIVLDQFRTAVISGHISWGTNALVFAANMAGLVAAIYLLDRNRKNLPFLF